MSLSFGLFRSICHSRVGGNPEIQKPLIQISLDSRYPACAGTGSAGMTDEAVLMMRLILAYSL